MNRYENLMQRITDGEQLLIDGATGTEVERRGVPKVAHAWNSGGALTAPETLLQIHEDYIRHGAEIVISNTFATGRNVTRDAGMEEQFEFLNRRGVELAIEARERMATPGVLVAGGISYWSFTGNPPSLEELHANTTEQAAIMATAGAELLMLEMMVGIERMMVTLDAAQTSALPVWVGLSCKRDAEGTVRLLDGDRLIDALDQIQDKQVPLISLMHTNVEDIDAGLDILQPRWSGPIGVYAHTGKFNDDASLRFGTVIAPEDYAAAAKGWLDRGVQIIGGCCGIGVDHIAALSEIV